MAANPPAPLAQEDIANTMKSIIHPTVIEEKSGIEHTNIGRPRRYGNPVELPALDS